MVFQTTNFINYQLPRHIKNCQTHNISRVHLGLHLQSTCGWSNQISAIYEKNHAKG